MNLCEVEINGRDQLQGQLEKALTENDKLKGQLKKAQSKLDTQLKNAPAMQRRRQCKGVVAKMNECKCKEMNEEIKPNPLALHNLKRKIKPILDDDRAGYITSRYIDMMLEDAIDEDKDNDGRLSESEFSHLKRTSRIFKQRPVFRDDVFVFKKMDQNKCTEKVDNCSASQLHGIQSTRSCFRDVLIDAAELESTIKDYLGVKYWSGWLRGPST